MSEISYFLHFSAFKIVFLFISPSYALSQLFDLKCQKIHYFAISVHKYHKSFF